MRDEGPNLPASVLARLRNAARAMNTDYQLILRRYAIKRMLHRLSRSAHSDQYILKGAMLFTAWLKDPFRPTQDLDLLGAGDPDIERVTGDIRDIARTAPDEADGLIFDADGLSAAPIREEQSYGGVRIKTVALLARARIPVQIDIGFGDAITPGVQNLVFPSLLSSVGVPLKAYPRETVVAEKLEAIVSLGIANSRMKDFYDLLALSRFFGFDGQTLVQAITATFTRRMTAVPATAPEGLSATFAADPQKQRQWEAFVGRESLLVEPLNLSDTLDTIADFALPPLKAAAMRAPFISTWAAGGPWRS